MSKRAWAYITAVLLTATGICARTFAGIDLQTSAWLPFAVMTCFATLAQLVETAAPGRTSYYATTVFFIAGIFLLPPWLFVVLVAVPHLAEWSKDLLARNPRGRNWYIQPFNIAMHIIPGTVARLLFESLTAGAIPVIASSPILAALLAVVVYVIANHVMLGFVLLLARNLSWRESQALDPETLLPEAIMACLGYLVAVVWTMNPWLMLVALSPLVLVHRALMVPMLKHEAQRDAKTGLFNARHFNQRFSDELTRAARFGRPMAVIMADLDLLRNINNTYGHLAGDAVLAGIGHIINEGIREYDLAARFGGEEFVIVLPETELSEARVLAERLRVSIEGASFEVSTSVSPIRATMSFGVACFPEHGTTTTDLIHTADVAVYQAKLQGRNRVISANDVPHAVPSEQARIPEVVAAPVYAAAYATRVQQPASSAGKTLGTVAVSATEHAPNAGQPASVHANTYDKAGQNVPGRTQAASVGTKQRPHVLMWLLVGSVIAMGVSAAVSGIMLGERPDTLTLVLMVALAALAELLQINVYDENTMSVSAAITFAAALLTGMVGLACVSATIALVHFWQKHPAWYKTAFNWAVHVLAGSAPILLTGALGLTIDLEYLPMLAGPILAAAVFYFAVESLLISGAISLATGGRLHIIWHAQFRWLIWHYVLLCILGFFLALAHETLGISGVLVFTAPIAMMRYAQRQYVDRTQDNVRELKRINKELIQANNSIVQLNSELFTTLAKIFDARDPYVGGHAAQVASYAVTIAQELGLPSERIEIIRQAGYLHDIGKIAIPETILHKPGKLTDAEFEQIKAHTVLGAEFLESSHGLQHLAPFVRYHHERWDGQGYPEGLSGEDIPLEARILNVCDSVEAMASDRPYHRGMTIDAIIAEVERCGGTQFDPAIVATFVRIAERAHRDAFVVNSARVVKPRDPLGALTRLYQPAA